MKNKEYKVAVVGATGLVGREMISVLENSSIPVKKLTLLASKRSAGEFVDLERGSLLVKELSREELKGQDIVLFAAGSEISRQYCPLAVSYGSVVIDNSSEFRMDAKVPLIVPEINGECIPRGPAIISNPNCSTIQMLLALFPLHVHAMIKRIIVSTYQSVSGVGKEAMDELMEQTRSILNCLEIEKNVFPQQIAFNVIPHIDYFHEDGYTNEEKKMELETQKILGSNSILVSATTVRVPTFIGHGESVNVEFHNPVTVNDARKLISEFRGLKLVDSPDEALYPMPIDCSGHNSVMVGRIRQDKTVPHGLNLWIIGDNLRKGAALNAVQIAEEFVKNDTKN